tara:strand:+ start:2921 stop:5899 length:2979 start_codon:yes stop_codon:yes gene_type:complete
MKWLILVVLAVGAIPAVYAEVGPNYDIVENEDGSFTWTSHPERIWDGEQWVEFTVNQSEDTIQVASNSIGTLVYDIQSCSYSIFDTGFASPETQILPSISWYPRIAEVGTDDYSGIDELHNQQCSVNVEQGEDWTIITATKDTPTSTLTQTLDIRTDNGIKETVSIFNNNPEWNNHKFALSQTVHTGDSITLGGNTYDVAAASGTVLDRTWIEDNEAQIFQIADSLSYDFDVGFEQFNALQVIDDNGTYKVTMDYSVNDATPIGTSYTVDPTFSGTPASNLTLYDTGNNNSCDGDVIGTTWSGSPVLLRTYQTTHSYDCLRGYFEYDTSSISDSVTITDTQFDYTVSGNSYGSYDCDIVGMANQPSTSTDSQSFTDITNGSVYVDSTNQCHSGSGSHDLGTTADTELQNNLPNDWFAVGMKLDDEVQTGSIRGQEIDTTPTLTVTYTTATVPDAITDLAASYNNPNVDLSWTLPSDGGDTITSFKVYRDIGSGYSLYDTITSATATSYQDTSPSLGNTNYYKVNAVNSIGEASDSNVASVLAGTPPDPPTGASTSIADSNAAPLTITVSWTSPSNVGTGTLTGFEIYRDGTLITTTGLVTTYDDTVSSSGTYVYKVRAVSTHGTSGDSNTSSISTPTVPNAINDLSGTADSNVQTSISWTAPSTGGSAITQYKVFRDSINIGNTTSTSYTDSGLSDGTTYLYNVFTQNNVGTSTKSNDLSLTTYTGVTGSITGTATTIGATTKIDVTPNVTAGTPTPTFNTFIVKEGAATITTFTGTTGYVHHTDDSSHTYTIESTDSTHWQSPTITGTISGVQASYNPSWSNNLSYNYTRSTNSFDLIVNRDVTPGWDLTCEYRTAAQASGNQTGTTGTGTNMYAFQDSQTISDGKHVYVTCIENNAIVLSFVSYGPNLITGGLQLLDTHFGDFLGAPAVLFFVILAAGMFTGRSANTGILVVLSIIGVLGFIGMVTIDEASWGFILIAGVLGLFVGKRFL